MPKATWGAGENMLTADDINNAEVQQSERRYSGELPPGGTYRFILKSAKKAVAASTQNNMVTLLWLLDGTWQPNHKKYDGAPVFHNLTLTKANAAGVRNFLDSIGGTSADLLTGLIVDDQNFITKMGKVGDPSGLMVYINTQHSKVSEKYPNKRLEVMYNGYLPVEDGDETAGGDDADAADDTEAPF